MRQIDIAPASIAQIQVATDGRLFEVSPESSQVAKDLEELDAGLKVRFSERGECYIIRHDWHSGCPHNGDQGPGSSYLVSSVKAHRGRSGVWSGLDERVVERFRQIDPQGRSGYDFVRELDRSRERAEREARQERSERFGDAAERTAHALRKDLGLGPYRGRVFLPRDLKRA